ncbi:bL21 family ribosomal protein [Citrobacter sp.]|uniref:large ribosomal subunit protein bL21 n=1 Tax=Citrobacter sp. TaxID=1896336 RepID=UPI0028FE3AA5|nr:bL21 family ribosomal protein [Citrobacter sp.]MDU1002686.1 bL21 family ribosomal protein [Citrobacter sp.]
MYAVFQSGGKQHRVSEGQTVRLEKLDIATGESVRKHYRKQQGHRQWFTDVKITGISA